MSVFIGVTANQDVLREGEFPGVRRQLLNLAYCEAVAAAGGVPVILPHMTDAGVRRAYLERIDGLLLSGGGDVAPQFYGEEPHELLGKIDSDRDGSEIDLTREAARRGLPVLGICRGLQVLNVAFGGTLYQDLSQRGVASFQHRQIAAREEATHTVRFSAGSVLAEWFGKNARVNSFHHQAIKRAAEGFKVNALAADGVIEGIEYAASDAFLMGVQWHPEHMAGKDGSMAALFENFVRLSEQLRERR